MKIVLSKVALWLFLGITATNATAGNLAIFGSPGFDWATGTGYKSPQFPIWFISTTLTNDGAVLTPLSYFESNVEQFRTHSVWRAHEQATIYAVNPDHISQELIGLSDSRHAVGQIGLMDELGEYTSYFARWSPEGDGQLLPMPDNSNSGDATDINANGVVVGVVGTRVSETSTRTRAMRWTLDGTTSEMAIPSHFGEVSDSHSRAINKHGQVAGSIRNSAFNKWFPVRWEADDNVVELSLTTNTELTAIGGTAQNINSSGAVAGTLDYQEGSLNRSTGAYWTPEGDVIELRHLPSDQHFWTQILDMNDRGEVLGTEESRIGSGTVERLVKWSPDGTPHELHRADVSSGNPLFFPMELNEFGYAVGLDPGGKFWYPNGDAVDLKSLLPPGSEWTGLSGLAISDTGWVSGRGAFNPAGDAPVYARGFAMLLPFAGTYGLGDANFDELIDFADLLIVAQNYELETNGSVDMGDFDLDGIVGFNDLLVVAQNYGSDPALLPITSNSNFASDWITARAMVPEPTSLISLVCAGGMLARRRGRVLFL